MRRYKRVIGNTLELRNDTFKSLNCMGDLGRALWLPCRTIDLAPAQMCPFVSSVQQCRATCLG